MRGALGLIKAPSSIPLSLEGTTGEVKALTLSVQFIGFVNTRQYIIGLGDFFPVLFFFFFLN